MSGSARGKCLSILFRHGRLIPSRPCFASQLYLPVAPKLCNMTLVGCWCAHLLEATCPSDVFSLKTPILLFFGVKHSTKSLLYVFLKIVIVCRLSDENAAGHAKRLVLRNKRPFEWERTRCLSKPASLRVFCKPLILRQMRNRNRTMPGTCRLYRFEKRSGMDRSRLERELLG